MYVFKYMAAPYRTVGGSGGLNLDANQVVATNASSDLANVVSGTTGQVLTSNGSSTAPTFQSVPAGANITGGNTGQVVFQSAPSTTTFTATASSGLLQTNGSAPAFTTTPNIGTATGSRVSLTPPSGAPAVTATLGLGYGYPIIMQQTDTTNATPNLIYMETNGKYTQLGQDTAQNTIITNSAAKLVTIGNSAGAIQINTDGSFSLSAYPSYSLLGTDSTGKIVAGAAAPALYPTQATYWYDSATVTSGSAISVAPSAAFYGGMQIFQNPSTATDISVTSKQNVLNGTYTLYAYGTTTPTSGIFNFSAQTVASPVVINGSPIDFYTSTNNVFIITIGTVNVTSNVCRIFVTCTGKNASSSAYNGMFFKFVLK